MANGHMRYVTSIIKRGWGLHKSIPLRMWARWLKKHFRLNYSEQKCVLKAMQAQCKGLIKITLNAHMLHLPIYLS